MRAEITTGLLLTLICSLPQLHCVSDDDNNNCESLRNCQQCIRAPTCGWYLAYRSVNGSGCFRNDDLERYKSDDDENGNYHPPKAALYVIKNRENAALSPQEVSVNLRANEPFTFPITFKPQAESWGKRKVEMKYAIKNPRIVKLTFFSNCSGQHDALIETSTCDNVEFGSSVEFLVQVEQLFCSKHQPERIRKVKINPFPSPAIFRLNLYAYCYCPCEMNVRRGGPDPEEIIPDCHRRGSFICGVCYCRDGYDGENCEINTTNTVS